LSLRRVFSPLPWVDPIRIRFYLQRLLREVHLGYLLERPGGLAAMEDWSDCLSIGEQQRLAFARLFVHNPAFAIIDVRHQVHDAHRNGGHGGLS
jgi:ABC-type ATPase involved in cell division